MLGRRCNPCVDGCQSYAVLGRRRRRGGFFSGHNTQGAVRAPVGDCGWSIDFRPEPYGYRRGRTSQLGSRSNHSTAPVAPRPNTLRKTETTPVVLGGRYDPDCHNQIRALRVARIALIRPSFLPPTKWASVSDGRGISKVNISDDIGSTPFAFDAPSPA